MQGGKELSMSKVNKGFTLIELIVVILILAILGAGSVVGFRTVYEADLDSSAQKLLTMLSKTRQEAVMKENGTVRLLLKQTTEGEFIASVLYHNGTSEEELYARKIGSASIKIKVKDISGAITEISKTPSEDPVAIVLEELPFSFKKSTGGLIQNYTDIILEGSSTKNIIMIKETGRCFLN